jgi:hypothetical protein
MTLVNSVAKSYSGMQVNASGTARIHGSMVNMHYHFVEDTHGNLVDLIPFCSDYCHQEWCYENAIPYGGWNGCHEDPYYEELCARCES